MSQHSGATPYNSTVLFICLAVVLFLALLVSLLVFLPAWRIKDFKATECKITKIDKVFRICDCGEDCFSRFPCLSIFVEFNDLRTGLLRKEKAVDGGSFYFSSGSNSECSFYPTCDLDQETSRVEVEEYLINLAIPRPRICHVNTHSQSDVIINKRRTISLSAGIIVMVSSIIVCQLIFLFFARSLYIKASIRTGCRFIQGGKFTSN